MKWLKVIIATTFKYLNKYFIVYSVNCRLYTCICTNRYNMDIRLLYTRKKTSLQCKYANLQLIVFVQVCVNFYPMASGPPICQSLIYDKYIPCSGARSYC